MIGMTSQNATKVFRCSQKVRDALAAEAASDCEHNIEDALSDGIDDSKTVRKMCVSCGSFFGYYTVEHIPIKVTAGQAGKIAVQMGQQKLAYNKTVAYLCGLLKEGLAHTEDKVTAYDATCLIPSEHKLYNELTRWRQDEVRFSKGASSLQRVGVSEARKAVKAHIKSWYKSYKKLEYCKSKDLKLSKSAVLLTAVPVWKPRGIKVENSHKQRKALFRTRRKQVRKNKKVLTVANDGYYDHDKGVWQVPKVGRIEARKLLDEGLITRSFHVIERPGEKGRRRWRVNATVLLRIPAPVSRDDIVENIVEHNASRVLGVDLGVNIPAMFSNGDSLMYVERIQELSVEGDRLQKKMSACRRQSRGWQQARSAYRKKCAQIRQIKQECIWAGMRKVCADNDVVVFEKLNIVGMRKSAKGTMEQPGTNVGAKTGLNRELGRVSWGTIIQICRAAAKFTGTRVILVDAKNSSRECASCGHIAAGNRETQKVFCCLACGYATNADLNASVVIERRGVNNILKVAGVVLPQGRMGSGSGIPPVRDKPVVSGLARSAREPPYTIPILCLVISPMIYYPV